VAPREEHDLGDEPDPKPLTVGRLLARGITRRCSVCGTARCFKNYFEMLERCPRCNFRFDRIDGQRSGALGINTIVSFGVLFLVVTGGLILTYPEFDSRWLLPFALGVTVLFPIFFYPFSRTIWNSIDLAMRPLEPDDDIDPRWIPPPARPRR
jgi:uncharacterized protein (DUF983 family)